jgi:hypothetical protein
MGEIIAFHIVHVKEQDLLVLFNIINLLYYIPAKSAAARFKNDTKSL